MSLNRSQLILQCRPTIETSSESELPIEKFQNTALRQILKFQNDILVLHYMSFLEKFKQDINAIRERKLHAKISNDIAKNSSLKYILFGAIIGLLNHEETEFYLDNQKEANKRIVSMLIDRLYDQILKNRGKEPSVASLSD